jgi:hypothetical protein
MRRKERGRNGGKVRESEREINPPAGLVNIATRDIAQSCNIEIMSRPPV